MRRPAAVPEEEDGNGNADLFVRETASPRYDAGEMQPWLTRWIESWFHSGIFVTHLQAAVTMMGISGLMKVMKVPEVWPRDGTWPRDLSGTGQLR